MCAYAGWMRSQGAEVEAESASDEDHEALVAAFKAAEKKDKS